MKVRHAAALALIGWYLMLPPWVAYNKFNANAPLSKWQQSGSYDSAAECEQERNGLAEYYHNHPKARDADWFFRVEASGLCVATDDPRLNSN